MKKVRKKKMTTYTETKRALQRIGFKVINRFGERDVLLEAAGTKIRLAADRCGHAAMYAATENGVPVSWHTGSRRCANPGKWLGFSHHIEVTPEELLLNRELELFCAMAYIAHVGHYTAYIEAEDIF
jgi:hypothetical protein